MIPIRAMIQARIPNDAVSVRAAGHLGLSRTRPMTLVIMAKGGSNGRTSPTRTASGVPQPGLSTKTRKNRPPQVPIVFAASLRYLKLGLLLSTRPEYTMSNKGSIVGVWV